MSTERGASSATVITVTAVVLLLLYPISFGPACWLAARTEVISAEWISTLYAPLLWSHDRCPNIVQQAIRSYANFGSGAIIVDISGSGVEFEQLIELGDVLTLPLRPAPPPTSSKSPAPADAAHGQ